jgi:uncharacterized membrane protein YfcA
MLIEDPFILWPLVGIVSGIILGLAGAGGGLIGIPMLIYLGGYGIKDATGYGLWGVSLGAATAWFVQRHNTEFTTGLILTTFSLLFAYLIVPLKEASPQWVIIILLNGACLVSIYSLWIHKTKVVKSQESPSSAKSALGGAIAGFLSTMTGLGGGVIMIPWMTTIGKLKLVNATATSLMVIAITAPFSIWAQGRMDDIDAEYIVLLTIGVVAASLITKQVIARVPKTKMDMMRKSVLTAAIIIAMIGTVIKI